jgi:hypothetical protein
VEGIMDPDRPNEEFSFYDDIIDEVISGNEDRLDKEKGKRYKMYLELKIFKTI